MQILLECSFEYLDYIHRLDTTWADFLYRWLLPQDLCTTPENRLTNHLPSEPWVKPGLFVEANSLEKKTQNLQPLWEAGDSLLFLLALGQYAGPSLGSSTAAIKNSPCAHALVVLRHLHWPVLRVLTEYVISCCSYAELSSAAIAMQSSPCVHTLHPLIKR